MRQNIIVVGIGKSSDLQFQINFSTSHSKTQSYLIFGLVNDIDRRMVQFFYGRNSGIGSPMNFSKTYYLFAARERGSGVDAEIVRLGRQFPLKYYKPSLVNYELYQVYCTSK